MQQARALLCGFLWLLRVFGRGPGRNVQAGGEREAEAGVVELDQDKSSNTSDNNNNNNNNSSSSRSSSNNNIEDDEDDYSVVLATAPPAEEEDEEKTGGLTPAALKAAVEAALAPKA